MTTEITPDQFTGTSIMDCPFPELQKIILSWLRIFDDAMQDLPKLSSEFEQLYFQLEHFYFQLKEEGVVTLENRNEIRSICKHAIKLGATQIP